MSKFDGLIQAKLKQKNEKKPKAEKNPPTINKNAIKPELTEKALIPETKTKVYENNDKIKTQGKEK